MHSNTPRAFRILILIAIPVFAGCVVDGDVGTTMDAMVVRCGPGDDPDSDTISTSDEGNLDADSDGTFNATDPDSDGDGLLDRDEAGDADCLSVPIDSDGDGIADFLDTDGNGDGEPDATQLTTDLDGDGVMDAVDLDIDGDGIANPIEAGPAGAPIDTDADGTPDVRDLDSDGDSISDRDEGDRDPDRDATPSFRDLDSDDDGVPDAIEAGDADLATPPRACGAEVNPVSGAVEGDGLPDYSDADSDNDGAGDGEEVEHGTDVCHTDTDGDGFPDLVEIAYEKVNCLDAGDGECGCATRASCGIPLSDYYVVLPFEGPAQDRELDFGTSIRVADVFMLMDVTGSMDWAVDAVRRTSARLVRRVGEIVRDTQFGVGTHTDFFGMGDEHVFRRQLAMTDPDRDDDGTLDNLMPIDDALAAITGADGGSVPESQTEALYRIATGRGETWSLYGGTAMMTVPNYAGDCLDGAWGAPCFRPGSLPIVVHFTNSCSHNGSPDDSGWCGSVMESVPDLAPAATTWDQMIETLTMRGVKYVGAAVPLYVGYRSDLSLFYAQCEAPPFPRPEDDVLGGGWVAYSPCYFMNGVARATGSVDIDGRPAVFDLPARLVDDPDSGTYFELLGDDAFVDDIAGEIERMVERVPLTIDTVLRDDPRDDTGVDATRFITLREPACHVSGDESCWTEPAGHTHDEAVAGFDANTFLEVVPGTRVRFHIRFENTFARGGVSAAVYVAFIDVRGDRSAILDTRQVYVVVPASSEPFLI
jgi:hypothetical protein